MVTRQSSTFGNATSRVWIPANALATTSGSPALGVTGGQWPVWQLDAASTEFVSANIVAPGMVTVNADLYWTNRGAGTGDVRLRFQLTTAADGDSVGGFSTSFDVTATAPSQDVLEVTRIATGISFASSPSINRCLTGRLGAEAADTLANDAGLLGVLLTKAS